MTITRRLFLAGVLSVPAAAVVAKASALEPPVARIYADGIHDDWAGLQAALDGRPFLADGHVISQNADLSLHGGMFRITRTLVVRAGRMFTMRECTIISDNEWAGDMWVRAEPGAKGDLQWSKFFHMGDRGTGPKTGFCFE